MSLYLSANKLKSDYGVIGDYLIEWRVGSTSGVSVFITGEGSDPLIQATHPFTDEIVQSGTLYPVIIYAYFNGQKYTLVPNVGDNYSPDLLQCLELYYVQIDGINCSNGDTFADYSHSFIYNNMLQPAVDAERTIKFDLNADGTSRFFAWAFNGYNVVDRFTIYYHHIANPSYPEIVTDWKIGSNFSGSYVHDLDVIPKKFDFTLARVVNDLQSFNHQAGDYLIIKIIPRTEEPTNTNTNWRLDVKCLSSFDDNNVQAGMRTLDTASVTMTYDVSNCRYLLRYKTLVPYILPDHYRKYLNTRWLLNCETSYNKNTQEYFVSFIYKIQWTTSLINFSNTCVALSSNLNIVKSGNVITYTFINNTDYQFYKTSYDNIINNVQWSNPSTDPNNPSFYNSFYCNEIISTSCGDSYTLKTGEIWRQSSFVFDDINMTVTITLATFTLAATQVSCDDTYINAYSLKMAIDNFINSADFNIYTNIRYAGFTGRTRSLWDRRESSKPFSFFYGEEGGINMFENPPMTGWNMLQFWNVTNPNYYGFDMGQGYVEITNLNDIVNNFRIKWKVKEDGTYYSNINAPIVYEIQNGVVIIG